MIPVQYFYIFLRISCRYRCFCYFFCSWIAIVTSSSEMSLSKSGSDLEGLFSRVLFSVLLLLSEYNCLKCSQSAVVFKLVGLLSFFKYCFLIVFQNSRGLCLLRFVRLFYSLCIHFCLARRLVRIYVFFDLINNCRLCSLDLFFRNVFLCLLNSALEV